MESKSGHRVGTCTRCLLGLAWLMFLFSSTCFCGTNVFVGNIDYSDNWVDPHVHGYRPEYYQTWADSTTFYADDNLTFIYNSSLNDVLLVHTEAELDNCSYNGSYVLYDRSPSGVTSIYFTLHSFSGYIYVMSVWYGSDCADGMKFKLKINPQTGSPTNSPSAAPSGSTQYGTYNSSGPSQNPQDPVIIQWSAQTNPDWANALNLPTFTVNSLVEFQFDSPFTLFQVYSQGNFENCDTTSKPTPKKYKKLEFVELLPGANFFIDGNATNCKSSFMKITFAVLNTGGQGSGSESSTNQPPNKVIIAASVAGACVLILILAGGGVWWYCDRKRAREYSEHREVNSSGLVFGSHSPWASGTTATQAARIKNLHIVTGPSCRMFSLEELDKATSNFSSENELGQGGFGTVYKGTLDDGTVVAIKRSKDEGRRDLEQFINEVSILSTLNNRNLVKLLGCCVDLEVPLLVFEFISNGTLEQHLALSEKGYLTILDWKQRFSIALETAEALKFLHVQATAPIIHRDVKSANILLDDNFNAKVVDFGLSKLVDDISATHVSTMVKGTHGYLDPDYYNDSRLTTKTDVYSFGVVLLELITSRKPLDRSITMGSQNLATISVPLIKSGRTRGLIDPKLVATGLSEHDLQTIDGVAQIAAACLISDRDSRPSMSQVVELLQTLKGSNLMAEEFYRNDSNDNQKYAKTEMQQAAFKKLLELDEPDGSGEMIKWPHGGSSGSEQLIQWSQSGSSGATSSIGGAMSASKIPPTPR